MTQNFFSLRFWCVSVCVCVCVCQECFLLFHVYFMFIVLQIAMTQRSLSMCFRSLVQAPPHMKRKHIIDAMCKELVPHCF